MPMKSFAHTTAASAQDAVELLARGTGDGARIVAGGTDLLPLMKEGIEAPSRLIDLKPARALRYLRFEPDGALHLGALATLADVERSTEVADGLPILAQAVRDAATPQLRAMATVAGNLLQRPRCWYFRGDFRCWLKGGDTCFARDGRNDHHAIFGAGPCVAVHPSDLAPALVALDAEIAVEGPNGARVVAIADFVAPPEEGRRIEHRLAVDEVIAAIHVPAQPAGARGAYKKAMDRQAWAFALASAAAQVTVQDGRIVSARLVLGGVANVPWRAREAEALLVGQAPTSELVAQAAERAIADAQPLAYNAYKVRLARELARRALIEAAGVGSA
ncbi:MAG TPA: FAD binding domain-containing protein [Ktedonobacterales bacterium]|nr:FAD binding domain-containing protein [Ktedonobacterales bacterium]